MIEKLLIIVFLLSPTCLTSPLIEVNESPESPEASQLNSKIPEDLPLIKRLKKQITRDNYDLPTYEREVNESLTSYYDEIKSAVDRYHARQKEISKRFSETQQTTASPHVNPIDANSADSGYRRIGKRTRAPDETLVYQNHIAVGSNGQSQVETVFHPSLGDGIRINCVELIGKNGAHAESIRIAAGGIGQNDIKLIFKSQKNRGLSYDVKIWGYSAFVY